MGDSGEGSNLGLLIVRTDPPTDGFLLKMVNAYAASVEGAETPEAQEDLMVGGRAWRTWRMELPEQGRTYWYLYRQEGEYALSITSSGPAVGRPPAILACFRGENSLAPVNQYLPPAGADGYFTAVFPPSLLGNRTPEELLEDFREDTKAAGEQGLTPDQFPRFRDLIANADGSVTYSFTEEQYRKSKEDYYSLGLRILLEVFGINPGDIIKRISYEQIDENGVPWGVGGWIDQTAYVNTVLFSDFIA